MTQVKPLRVLVVGGGIGGLAAALALRMQGHEVEVFEKSTSNTELGNAVYCAPNCTAALGHLGINPDEIGGVLYRGANFLDSDCNVKAAQTPSEEQRATWPAEWYLLTRLDLHSALKRKAAGRGIDIRTSCPIRSMDPTTGSIFLEDGTTVIGDLLVGADGIHSAVRSDVVGRVVPLISNRQACFRFMIPTAELLREPQTRTLAETPGTFAEIAGYDRRIVMYPCLSGEVMNYVAFVPRDEIGEIKKGLTNYDQFANKAQLRSHFKTFSPGVQRMLDLVPENSIRVWDLVDMELLQTLFKDKAVLIGDAAHPFMPHMGQGAAQAIEDGCALGVVLPLGVDAEDIPQRLEFWQKLRRDRAAKIVEYTRHRARPADGSQGPTMTPAEFTVAMEYCCFYDAWTHAEDNLKSWEADESGKSQWR